MTTHPGIAVLAAAQPTGSPREVTVKGRSMVRLTAEPPTSVVAGSHPMGPMGHPMALEGAHPPTCWIPAPSASDGTPVARRCRPHESSSSSSSSSAVVGGGSTRYGQVQQQQQHARPQQLMAQVII